MTSHLEQFGDPPGYQFQDGDEWLSRPHGSPRGFWIRLTEDGTRRITEFDDFHSNAHATGQRMYDRNPSVPVYFLPAITIEPPVGSFVGYDWAQSEGPPNQYFDLLQYREHASRFAHQLDDALGHHSLTSASEENRMVTFQTLSSMIGSGWMRYKIWDAIDPEELVTGGNFVGVPLWKRHREEYVEIDRLMCGQCDIATFARRFLFQANLPLFRRLYRSGVLYVANRTATPWEATIFAVASDPVSTFYDNLETEYHQALLYYDEVVGAADNS